MLAGVRVPGHHLGFHWYLLVPHQVPGNTTRTVTLFLQWWWKLWLWPKGRGGLAAHYLAGVEVLVPHVVSIGTAGVERMASLYTGESGPFSLCWHWLGLSHTFLWCLTEKECVGFGVFFSLKLFCLARLLFVWLEGKLVYVFFVCFICWFLSAHWHFWFADSSSKSGIHEAERELTVVMFLKNLLMLVLYIIVTFG